MHEKLEKKKINKLFRLLSNRFTTCHQVQLYTIKDKHKQLGTIVESIFARLGGLVVSYQQNT